jgi:rRNA processing protein Krr1/Pno1
MEKNENGVVGDEHDTLKLSEMDTFDPSWSNEGIRELEFVSFSKRYPKHIGQCLQQSLPKLQYILGVCRFSYTLDTSNCCMTLSTTWKEPDLLRKGKELLQLLAVNIPAEIAFKLFNGSQAYIIKTGHQDGGLCKAFMINDEQFIQRTNILRDSRKALERLTSCEIFIQVQIVVVIGKSQGIKMVRAMVKDCIVSNESPAPKIRSAERDLARKDIEAVRRRLHEKQH